MAPLRVAGVARVSTPRQRTAGYSLPEQQRAITQFCEERNLTLVEIVAEDYTGTELARPAVLRLRELATEGAIDLIVCPRVDRWARAAALGIVEERWFAERGVRVLYVDQQFEDSPTGRFHRLVMGGVAELELDFIKERMRRGKEQKARERAVLPSGGAAYGYRQVSMAEAQAIPEFDGRGGEWLLVPERARIVEELFRRLAAGATLNSLLRWLIESGAPTAQGGRWHKETLRYILRNPAYTGGTVYGRWQFVRTPQGRRRRLAAEGAGIPIRCPPIITPELWRAAQERLDANRALTGPRTGAWLLRGCVTCGHCGAPCRGKKKTNLRNGRRYEYRYYTCRDGCVSIRADRLEAIAADAVRAVLRPGKLERAAERVAAQRRRDKNPLRVLEQARGDVDRLWREEARLTDSMLRSGAAPEAFRPRFADVQRRRAEAEARVAEAEAALAMAPEPGEARSAASNVAAMLAGPLCAEVCRQHVRITLARGEPPRVRIVVGELLVSV